MTADALRFPTLAAYLRSLPEGLSSHPSAQIKGAVLRDVNLPQSLAGAPGLPREVGELLLRPPPASIWFPEVHFHALLHAVYDHSYGSTRAVEYEQWTTAGTRALLTSPLYRIAFMLITPARLMRSLQSRWELLRRGTELQLDHGDESSCLLRIKHPLALYSDLHRRTRAATLRTVIECAGGKSVTTRIASVTLLSWQVLCKWEP